ncbi:hypothetical protein HWN40_06470 [Methanolobus zinderi]|jgi:hypothetical protein|uniref:Uncharacterized protein n=1 Tax=Methanolobus zinderi TaxID=536044 RepID=A0A7D5EE60_9EURY|nr:hypothetical protein [Methanolobus zinderi]KXS42936.1 MAG: hypothetical protein AWU59_1404 [Methanolobus sp. T82-4]QLC49916.1 hypothetical protein HWN40_06470 [Methanolobus zinderi]
MKLPAPIKHALIEAMISQYSENHPASRVREEPLTFSVPVTDILEDTSDFNIIESDIQDAVDKNPASLSFNDGSDTLQFIPPFTRSCELYDDALNYFKENTASNPKFTLEYDPAIKESLIYNFFTGSIVMIVPDRMTSLSQLHFALMAGGSKLRAIMDSKDGGWVYVFPKFIMEYMECGKTQAKDTNVQQVLASYLEDIFPE